jgi:hypothetical protein
MDLSDADLERIPEPDRRVVDPLVPVDGDVVTSGWEGPTAVDEIDDP